MVEKQSEGSKFEVRKIYLKDSSFESPLSPQIFGREIQPSVDVQLRMNHALLDQEHGLFESVLTLTVTAKAESDTIFLCEVQQAGLFEINDVTDSELEIALDVACPTSLFPFAREAISELVGKGGFPQLLVNPINFEAMYRSKQHEKQATESAEGKKAH